MSEPVKRIQAPVRMAFQVKAGKALSRFLNGLADGEIIGQRCPSCSKVYVPPKGACPTCGVLMGEEVRVADTGTLTTFCIVRVPFEGQTMKLPYVYGSLLLDGADLPILHLIEMPAEEARMGLRVKASWLSPAERKPSMESIRWFSPTGEPDAPFESYKDHL